MIDPELLDLVPLFVSEGRRRMERLFELAPGLGTEGDSLVEARRELHTLKGSCRMLNVRQLADLCHEGETVLQEPDASTPETLLPLLDRLSEGIDRLERGEDLDAEPAPAAERPDAEPGADAGDHRVSAEAADRLASGATASRLLALSGLSLSSQVDELAQLAESGVGEPLPRQVLAMLATRLRRISIELESQNRRALQIADRQVERLLRLQLQPLRPLLQSLARHSRELAGELGKEIEVVVEGGDARLDRRIATELNAAFLHLVRNAVDHGMEEPDARTTAGKDARGRLRLAATSYGDRVEILVADDGPGIDADSVRRTAVDSGLLSAEADIDDREILQLVFSSGFSTRRTVSAVSGRGVGLDAVGAAVRQLGGEVWIESEPGQGTEIHVQVPAARRGERVLVLREDRFRVALPKSAVDRILKPPDSGLLIGDSGPVLRLEGQLYKIVHLAPLLGLEELPHEPTLISLRSGSADKLLAVEEIEDEDEVLVRPFRRSLGLPEHFAGMALLPTGEPVPVLAPRNLLSETVRIDAGAVAALASRLRVLLVEDSLVTREMERRMLEEEGFDVTATENAEEALGALAESDYDCLVTDLEMPGMNGFELTRRVRGIERLEHLPVIIVSTRDQPGDRLAGLEAGADAYIPKQMLESRKLASVIRRMGRGR